MNQARLRRLNEKPIQKGRGYVLYWMQMYRRLRHNHALDYAVKCATELGLPLIVYEGLRLDYPWAADRHHHFVLSGMSDNAKDAAALGVTYWPFAESPTQPARGLLRQLCANAALVVSDDFPCFIIPEQSEKLASKIDVAMFAVDGNSVIPLRELGTAVSAAAHLRPRIQKQFAKFWPHRAQATASFAKLKPWTKPAPFTLFDTTQDLDAFIATLPIDHSVKRVKSPLGGRAAGLAQLDAFIEKRLNGYSEFRSIPAAPARGHSSGLSPYLHFGHVSIDEVVERALQAGGGFDPIALMERKTGKREGFYSLNNDVSGFLDEAITWRDVGFHWHSLRRQDTKSLATALPAWAQATLAEHLADERQLRYTLEELESGTTHDNLWNAAQKELVVTGMMHNYLRMLWGKKVLEWSATPEQGYQVLEHLNNKYALDGRNPNSYTGILWCFGLFDRPWFPVRKVFGTIRYMSSDNTGKKFKLQGYYEYVGKL